MEPLELYVITVKIFIPTCGLILSLLNLKHELKRTKELKNICKKSGWEFHKKGETAQLNNLLHFCLFSSIKAKKKQIRNLLYNKNKELNTAVFDYYIDENKRLATLIYFRSPQLNMPNFNLRRKPYIANNTFGEQDIVFSANSEFSDKYALFTDDEAAIRE